MENTGRSFRTVKKLYERTPAAEFGPKKLKIVRQRMVDAELSRNLISSRISRIKHALEWASGEQIISPTVFHGLQSVDGLRRGHTDAREPQPVRPVEEGIVERTLSHRPNVVRDMVQFKRLRGARPKEICKVRPANFDRTGNIWVYSTKDYNTAHLDRRRISSSARRPKKSSGPTSSDGQTPTASIRGNWKQSDGMSRSNGLPIQEARLSFTSAVLL
jgi:hypothetical protein